MFMVESYQTVLWLLGASCGATGTEASGKQSERREALKKWGEKLIEWEQTEPGKVLAFGRSASGVR